jgi:sulfotransferase family protein
VTEQQSSGLLEAGGTLKHRPARNPYLFIVGCPRSGTTLLGRMLGAHPDVDMVHETHWIPRQFQEGIGLTPDGLVTPQLIPSLFEERRFVKWFTRWSDRLRVDREDLERLRGSEAPISYAGFVSRIFDLQGEAHGKRLVGDKTPDYVRHIPTLHLLWPEAKFVHLIRDGRDVCLSVMSWKRAPHTAGIFPTWAEDPFLTTALWWERNVRLGREDGGSLGADLYYELRYESLVADPAGACAALCGFLGVRYDDVVLRFHEGRTRTDPGLDAKAAWRPVTRGLRDWRSQMAPEDVERFEAIAGDLLEELGYTRANPRPGAEALEYAARIRQSFDRDVRTSALCRSRGYYRGDPDADRTT